MSRTLTRLRSGAAALGIAMSLGFGATQALAAPPTASGETLRACDPAACNRFCVDRGAAGGYCTPGGNCVCVF